MNDSDSKHIICNFCGASDARYRFTLQDHITKNPGDFQLYECTKCGLLTLYPRPSWGELAKFYPDEYHAYQKKDQKSFWKAVRGAGWHRRVRAVTRRQPAGKLLDVGCATGEFLAAMEATGNWQTYGVEPVAYAAEMARERTKATVHEGFLQQAAYPNDSFDVVSLWDVLEHSDDPAALLHETWRILRPGGLLVTRLPNPDSLLAKLFGANWIAYDAPRHLYDIPQDTLRKYLLRLGFTHVELATLSSDHFTFFASLSVWLSMRARSTPILKKASEFAWRIANSAIGRTLLSPVFWSLALLGKGSSPVYFAYKPT